MKKSLLFNVFVFCFLGFYWQSNVLASNTTAIEIANSYSAATASFIASPLACNTPTWPTTSNITQNSATFSWDDVSGAQSYTVQTRLPYGTWVTIANNPVWNTYVTVNGFNSNTTYEWRVRANCSSGQYSGWTYPTSFTTSGSYGNCYPPEWLYTTNITQTSATWDWSNVNGCSSYSIQWRYPGGTWYNLSGGPFYNSWVNVSGLDPGTTYEWRVRSNCPNGVYSDWSYPASFTTLGYSCGVPYWTSTTNITSSSATFNWSSVSGAVAYVVEYRLPNGTWYTVPGSPTYGTWISVSGLNSNTTYQWRVRADCSGGAWGNWTSPITFTTLGGYYCNAPEWLYTTGITQSAATFDWAPVSGALSYTVEYRLAYGTWYTLPGSPFNNTWASISGLQSGTAYQWRVRSNCSNGQYSAWSYTVNFTTLNYSCSTPTWTYTSNVSSNSATFSWSSVYGALSYTVQTRLPNGTWYDIPGGNVYGTSVTVNNLNPNTTYQWRVRANCDSWQTSNWTSPLTFTTNGASCEAPSWLYTSNITQNSATWSWNSVAGAESYSLQWRYPGGTWYNLSGGPWTNTWVSVTSLDPATTYEWRVRANCWGGNYSPWSYSATFTTLGNSCGVPYWTSTTNITSTSATFNWSSVPGAVAYVVQNRYPNGTWYDVPGSPTSNTSITVNGLSPNTAYQWRVRADCSGGAWGNWTSPVYYTTSYGSSCGVPYWTNTTNITSTSATFNWSSVSGAVAYVVEYRLPNSTWYSVPGSPTSNTSITVNGLSPNTTYQWRVRADCSGGAWGDWTSPITFTTGYGSSCGVPNSTSTTNITSTSATFNWSSVSGAVAYVVEYRLPNGTWYSVPGSPTSNTSITVNGLSPNTTYQWRVRADCSGGAWGDWTSPISFNTGSGSSCNAPTGLSTTNVTDSTATFNWSAVSGAVNYVVQLRVNNGVWYDLAGSPFSGTTATAHNLSSGTTYQWRVKTNCGSGQYSNWSSTMTFTTAGVSSCGVPTNVTTTNITQTTATWSWSPVSGAVSYSIQWRYPGGAWYALPGGPWSNTSLNIAGLQPSTEYEWHVRANCNNGMSSAWSDISAFTTLGNNCGMPTGTFTSDISENSATFNWTAVPGAQNYTVQTRIPNGTWYNAAGGPFANSPVTIAGFLPNTTYQWRVRANCGNGVYSNWTNPLNFTTTGSTVDNDNCANATVITVNSTCVNTAGTNVGATPSTPSPVGGCPSSGYKDVWFRFTMPSVSNPTVTIRTTAGSLTNAVMEIYVGTSCSDLSYLTCENDNNNGNGSLMPVVNLIGYSNAQIWVRVWGFSGSTGSFSICVLDYQSNNFTGADNEIDALFDENLDNLTPEVIRFNTENEITPVARVSPNPASDMLNVRLEQTDRCKVTEMVMNDLAGKIVFKQDYEYKENDEFSEEIDVSHFVPGIYILRMVTTSGIISEKVVVTR